MNDLQNQVAIITGAGQGIARTLAAHGARVIVTDVEESRAAATAQEIESSGGIALGLHQDVAALQSMEQIQDKAIEHFGRVDILVNNAGVAMQKPFDQVTEEAWTSSTTSTARPSSSPARQQRDTSGRRNQEK